jgi:hypothetical protein
MLPTNIEDLVRGPTGKMLDVSVSASGLAPSFIDCCDAAPGQDHPKR